MKIQPYVLNRYCKTSRVGAASAAVSIEGKQEASQLKADTIVISRDAKDRSLVSGLARQITAQLEENNSPQRLQELKQQIQSGNYHVSSDELAEAMLSGILI